MDFLQGLQVLDFSHVLSGPYCTMLLGDYGADVIKVERPEGGDVTRSWGPPFAGGESTYFLSFNRNKRSLTLDLKTEAGRRIARALAEKSDVLVENFSPGAMARLGLDYAALSQAHPGLVYCSLSGYGQTGPDRGLPGFDVVVQARGGLMSLTGTPAGPPTATGVAVVDFLTGLHALSGILSALLARERTGRGACLDCALLDSQASLLSHLATGYLMTGRVPARRGNTHNSIVPYQTFQARDGYVNIAVGNEKLWHSFCGVLGLEILTKDPRFVSNALRVEHREALLPHLEKAIATRAAHELAAELSAAHVPAGVVQDVREVFTDPQVLARQMLAEMDHPAAGTLRMPAFPGLVDGVKPPVRRPPPLLGQHTAEVLKEKLGYNDERIAELKTKGVL